MKLRIISLKHSLSVFVGDDGKEELCSGRGECTCKDGKPWCKCEKDWSGEDCSCSLKTGHCYSPYTNSICSSGSSYTDVNRDESKTEGGKCECNNCVCPKVNFNKMLLLQGINAINI